MYISENILKKNINETEQSVSDLFPKQVIFANSEDPEAFNQGLHCLKK